MLYLTRGRFLTCTSIKNRIAEMKNITTILATLLFGLVLCKQASAQLDEETVHIGFSLPEVALMDVE